MVSSTKPDTLTNLLALLPTGTYLTFSAIIPITTNNGNCDGTEKIVTGILVFLFAFLCAFLRFTDSYSADNGTIWYGVVTAKGLWNPFFANSSLPDVTGWTYMGGGTKYNLKQSDYYIASLSVVSFLSLTLLSSAFSDCYYPGINGTILKAVPLPVNFFVGIALSFAPPARHGVGFAFTTISSASASIVQQESQQERPLFVPSVQFSEVD